LRIFTNSCHFRPNFTYTNMSFSARLLSVFSIQVPLCISWLARRKRVPSVQTTDLQMPVDESAPTWHPWTWDFLWLLRIDLDCKSKERRKQGKCRVGFFKFFERVWWFVGGFIVEFGWIWVFWSYGIVIFCIDNEFFWIKTIYFSMLEIKNLQILFSCTKNDILFWVFGVKNLQILFFWHQKLYTFLNFCRKKLHIIFLAPKIYIFLLPELKII
jgi:hypothetical protein